MASANSPMEFLEFLLRGHCASPYHHDSMKALLSNEKLGRLLGDYECIGTAAVFAGLTTCPELQSNLYRLEALVHASLKLAAGRRRPTLSCVSKAFVFLRDTSVAMAEDPAEDVFISCVSDSSNTFRTFEGLWESNAFFLERFLDISDRMPDHGSFARIKRAVLAMLKLSDAVVSRCDLKRYIVGNEDPVGTIPLHLLKDLSSLSDRVIFTRDALAREGIEPIDLAPFIFDMDQIVRCVEERPSTTLLERRPIVFYDDRWYLMLPAAIGAAIRIFVIQEVSRIDQLTTLEKELACSYAKHFHDISLLGDLRRPSLGFIRSNTTGVCACDPMIMIDEGRYVHFIFLVDDFTDASKGWLLGCAPNPKEVSYEIAKSIESAVASATQKVTFKDGITLIVACGWGRSLACTLPEVGSDDWKIETLSAPDLTTLSLSPGFNALTLWRLLDARHRLTKAGVVLQNVNGLLNLYGWSKDLNYHLVPHESVPAEHHIMPFLVCVNQNSLLRVRQEAYEVWDTQFVVSPEGKRVKVCKFSQSYYFKEDRQIPLYCSRDDLDEGKLRAVYIGRERDWWCSIAAPTESDRGMVYELLRSAISWMHKLVAVLERTFGASLPETIAWHLEYSSVELSADPVETPDYTLLKERTTTSYDGTGMITVTFAEDFMQGYACESNIAERCVLWAFVKGVVVACNREVTDAEIEGILDAVIADEDAKSLHLLGARVFLDYVAESLPKPITIAEADDATLRIGLGWRCRTRVQGSPVLGIEACTSYLGALVDQLWGDVSAMLAGLDRTAVADSLLKNIQAIRVEESRWSRTIRACLAQHEDKDDVIKAATRRRYSSNGALLASRLVIEMSLCTCPLEGGAIPGNIEMARLLAYAAMLYYLGGWSDAIKLEAIPAEVRISHFGSVMVDSSFQDRVLYRFGDAMHRRTWKVHAAKYGELFQEDEPTRAVEHLFDARFNRAWLAEFGFTIDQCRAFLDHIENIGITREAAVIPMRRSELMQYEDQTCGITPGVVEAIIKAFHLWPRSSWTTTPEGFSDSDWYPWKFKRRLSLVSRPLIQLENTDDPLFLVAPAIMRDCIVNVFRCSYEAEYDDKHFNSQAMRQWIGHKRATVGRAFNKDVAMQLEGLGWSTRSEVKLPELCNTKLDKDDGDIDVLAWNMDSGRLLAIECKNLLMARTHGEIASHLQEFRGRLDDKGRPDRLKRHLNRIEVLKAHMEAVAKYVGFMPAGGIEAHLVFANLVPVAFSTDPIFRTVMITDYDSLASI